MNPKIAMIAANCVADEYGITLDDLLSKRRESWRAEARFIVFLLLRRRNFKYAKMGTIFGKNHGAIICGVRRAQSLIDTDPNYNEVVNRCQTRFETQIYNQIA